MAKDQGRLTMKRLLIPFIALNFLNIPVSNAQNLIETPTVSCEIMEGSIVCVDSVGYHYIFTYGVATTIANLNTGEYVYVGAEGGGNIYTEQAKPKKKNFWDKVGKFGRALEEGFDNDRDAPEAKDYDPLCVTQLQRKVNECDD